MYIKFQLSKFCFSINFFLEIFLLFRYNNINSTFLLSLRRKMSNIFSKYIKLLLILVFYHKMLKSFFLKIDKSLFFFPIFAMSSSLTSAWLRPGIEFRNLLNFSISSKGFNSSELRTDLFFRPLHKQEISFWYSTVQYSTYSTGQHNKVQYSTVQYSTVQYSTVQYNTAHN